MAARPPSPAQRPRDGGFALIIVLWTLVLIAFIVAHLVGSGRVEIRIAGNLAANAVTEAAADGAVSQSIFNLLDPDPERRWPLDGGAHQFSIGDCRVTVRIEDEAALINPNLAAPALLEALLRVSGSDRENARSLAAAIGEWVGTPGAARAQEATTAEYRAAGLDYAPPSERAQTLDELRRVHGMTPRVFAAIHPHLSLFAPAVPSLAHADPIVVAAMAALVGPGTVPAGPAPPRPSDVLTARIIATAEGPNNARARRIAVVRVMPSAHTYSILSWDHGDG